MRALTIKAAKAHLNELVEAAIAGEDVVLMRGSKHVAAIVPLTADDLEVAPRISDEQARRFWQALEDDRAATTEDFDSMDRAVAALRAGRPTARKKASATRALPRRARAR
ncbi:MAG: type II toxin-antitoxin system Phd/YefM family antitoxin [Myxococcales bacterium]|nr:type II toxin-antitoxin system Phd/YefM family antitoxin [Myxococcales bacterium]